MRKKALAALALSVIVFVVAGGFYVKFRSKVLLNNFSFPQAEINGEKITPEKEDITACRRPWVPDFAKSLLSAEYRAVYDNKQRDSVTAPGGKVQINYDGNYSAHVKWENFSAEPDREGMLYLPQPGEYTLEMKAISEDKKIQGTAEFRAIIEVPKTAVVFSDTSPLQGALVRVYVKGLFPESEITVDSPVFSSSGISYNREEMSAFFYIPITYYRRSGEYPIKVFSDGQEVGQTTLNVKKYDFSVVSFDVDRETTASTVGSRTANSE